MLVSFVEVRDLNNFIKYLEKNGFNIVESVHSILSDSSELLVLDVYDSEGRVLSQMFVHYIDTHYAYLSELPPDADDRSIIEKLLEAEYSKIFWRVCVEPVLYVAADYRLIRVLGGYADSYPVGVDIYLDRYRLSGVKIVNSLIESAVELAKRLAQNAI